MAQREGEGAAPCRKSGTCTCRYLYIRVNIHVLCITPISYTHLYTLHIYSYTPYKYTYIYQARKRLEAEEAKYIPIINAKSREIVEAATRRETEALLSQQQIQIQQMATGGKDKRSLSLSGGGTTNHLDMAENVPMGEYFQQPVLQVSTRFKGLLLYTGGVLFHVECCIRELRCSSIVLHNITSITYVRHTNFYPLLNI